MRDRNRKVILANSFLLFLLRIRHILTWQSIRCQYVLPFRSVEIDARMYDLQRLVRNSTQCFVMLAIRYVGVDVFFSPFLFRLPANAGFLNMLQEVSSLNVENDSLR